MLVAMGAFSRLGAEMAALRLDFALARLPKDASSVSGQKIS
jgi:hypothetical protein